MIELTISETVLFLIPGTKSLCLIFVNNSECNPPPNLGLSRIIPEILIKC